MPNRSSERSKIEFQRKCQNRCQKGCQIECQNRCQKRMRKKGKVDKGWWETEERTDRGKNTWRNKSENIKRKEWREDESCWTGWKRKVIHGEKDEAGRQRTFDQWVLLHRLRFQRKLNCHRCSTSPLWPNTRKNWFREALLNFAPYGEGTAFYIAAQSLHMSRFFHYKALRIQSNKERKPFWELSVGTIVYQ